MLVEGSVDDKQLMMDVEYKPAASRQSPLTQATRLFLLLLAVASMGGLTIYIVFTFRKGPVFVKEMATGTWLCSMNLFFALQAHLAGRLHFDGRCSRHYVTGAYVIIVPASFAIFVGYAMSGNHDGWVWGLLLFIVTLLGLLEMIQQLRAAPPESRPQSKLGCCLSGYNLFNLFIGTFLVCLLANGAVSEGTAQKGMPLRGSFASFVNPQGKTQKVAFNCEGPSGKPVYIIDADESHGLADFWPLQRNMTASGRRSCIFDKLGLGNSDFLYADQAMDHALYYDALFNAIGEKGPFGFICWGGGGKIIWNYALLHPEKVRSVVLLDSFGENIESRLLRSQVDPVLSPAEIQQRREWDIIGRQVLFTVLRGLAIPWGLGTIFFGQDPGGYAYPERWAEYKRYYTVGKTWTTQYFTLMAAAQQGYFSTMDVDDWGSWNNTVPAQLVGKPMMAVYTNKSETEWNECNGNDDQIGSAKCRNKQAGYRVLKAETVFLATLTRNASYYGCNDPKCDLGFPLRFPNVIVDALNFHGWQ
jgi:pimeloyl-ACP methyl ester carboxylesterase